MKTIIIAWQEWEDDTKGPMYHTVLTFDPKVQTPKGIIDTELKQHIKKEYHLYIDPLNNQLWWSEEQYKECQDEAEDYLVNIIPQTEHPDRQDDQGFLYIYHIL